MDVNFVTLTILWCVASILVQATQAEWRSIKTEQLLKTLRDYQLIIPHTANANGDFISHDVTSVRRRRKRYVSNNFDSDVEDSSERLFFHVPAYGRTFKFNVTSNRRLTSGSYQVEYWDASGVSRRHGRLNNCHYVGEVQTEEHGPSKAVLSNCYGLHGFFNTQGEKYFIEPLWNHTTTTAEGHPHIIYRGSDIKSIHNQSSHLVESCGTKDLTDSKNILNVEKQLETSSQDGGFLEEHRWRTRRRRSTSTEHFVETLIVADKSMLSYHGKTDVESYILSIMNMVATLYHDASIGNSIHIVVSRIILLTEDQPTLKISHNADKSLDSFCQWQRKVNPSANKLRRNKAVAHHDNAILLTRYDICTYKNEPCGTLGLAPVAGMCEEDRSCSINEDIGLASAFTVAHEMGHNFGMQHDGSGNDCGKPGHDSAKIMASQLTKNTDPFSWSKCSKEYITGFLDSGRGKCLENPPPARAFSYPSTLPGEMHSADDQCALQYGSWSKACRKKEVCSELWCTNRQGQCRTNSIPAVDGTACNTHKVRNGWCYHGKCAVKGYRAKSVDGQWGDWTSWGSCSRTCGGGVESSARSCNNPQPENSGKYCLGERKRYRSCNVKPCLDTSANFREEQCKSYNDVPFRGKYYDWKPFNGGQVNPCAVNCLAIGYNFYTERAPKVIDGTECYPDRHDMCINGECVRVGCDKILGSNAVEDRCRVCGGDGSSCETIKGHANDPLSEGTYQQVVKIPKGAIHIKVSETVESNNYLALKTSDGRYHINGGWTIDWPRNFELAGTVFHYERELGQVESLKALGPTSEDIFIMLLLQEKNKGITYQYNLAKSPSHHVIVPPQEEEPTVFIWQYSPWSGCSVSCGKGISKAVAVCIRKDDQTVVKDSYCSKVDRLSDLSRACTDKQCPAEWVIGKWAACSKTCGGGYKTRSVYCMRRLDDKEQEMLNDDQCMTRKPKSRASCNRAACPAVWAAGPWSRCSSECGTGTKRRSVYCRDTEKQRYLPYKSCDLSKRPPSRIRCTNGNCPPAEWKIGKWGECSSKCGEGQQRRTVQCHTYSGKISSGCDERRKPPTVQTCSSRCDVINETAPQGCQDVDSVEYCHLVLKFKICGRPYFHRLCCQTCSRYS